MHGQSIAATALLVAVTTIVLSACGPDDRTTTSADQSSAAQTATVPSTGGTATGVSPSVAFGASASLSTMRTGTPDAASDSAIQSVQASLAADSQQVAPVMHYAPGDSGESSSN